MGGVYLGDGTTCNPSPCDCNNNGIDDDVDIGNLTSEDCNTNGIPDECEPGACCFVSTGRLCAGGSADGQPCPAGGVCPGGGICVTSDIQACSNTRQAICEAPPVNGVFRGVCVECPEQNAGIILEGAGTVFIHIIGPPVECPTGGGLAQSTAGCTGPPFFDFWVSNASGDMCHNFGSPDTQPIPADFFGPGSDSFGGIVCLRGVPLGIPGAGKADTQIRRSDDPFSTLDLPGPDPLTVDIEIVALSLESVSPITVTFDGGLNPETWDVDVDLAPGGLLPGTPPSTLTATKTHCNGGTYTSVLHVQPRFTFTKVGSPTTTAVLDTQVEGVNPIELVQSTPMPWVAELDPDLGAQGDPCSKFHPGIEDFHQTTVCPFCGDGTCTASIEDQCNCSSDCGAPPASEAGLCTDSLDNDCDGAIDCVDSDCAGTSACCLASAAPTPIQILDSGGTLKDMTANRFLIFRAGTAGQSQAIRVTLANLKPPYDVWNGLQMWVGPPKQASEAGSSAVPVADFANFSAAQLQCTPHCMDWTTAGDIHVFHEAVVPQSDYGIEVVDCNCDLSNPNAFSPSTPLATVLWGDVLEDFSIVPHGPPDSSVTIVDVLGILEKFVSAPTAVRKGRADLEPNCLDLVINISDALSAIQGFQGIMYSFPPKVADPCDSPCTHPVP